MPLRWPEIVKSPEYKANWNRSFSCSFWHGTWWFTKCWRMTDVYPEYKNHVYCPVHKAWWVIKPSKFRDYIKEFGK